MMIDPHGRAPGPARSRLAPQDASDLSSSALADPAWGRDAGRSLVELARSTPYWPLAFDWAEADPDPRLHLRRLSALLERRGASVRDDGPANLGALLSSLRQADGRSLVEAAADAGIDPVALALAEQNRLHSEERTGPLLARLAWGFRTTVAHLAAIFLAAGAAPWGSVPVGQDLRPRYASPSMTEGGGDLSRVLRALSSASEPTRHGLELLGGQGGRNTRVGVPILTHPLACPPVADEASGLLALPVIRPDRRRRPGYAQVVATVTDARATPVPDVVVRLALSAPGELPGRDPAAVTDHDGVATLLDVWLDEVSRATGETLRLPLLVSGATRP